MISSIIVQSRQKNFMYMLDQQYFFLGVCYIIYIIYYITLNAISIINIYSELKGLQSMDMSVLSNRPAQR